MTMAWSSRSNSTVARPIPDEPPLYYQLSVMSFVCLPALLYEEWALAVILQAAFILRDCKKR